METLAVLAATPMPSIWPAYSSSEAERITASLNVVVALAMLSLAAAVSIALMAKKPSVAVASVSPAVSGLNAAMAALSPVAIFGPASTRSDAPAAAATKAGSMPEIMSMACGTTDCTTPKKPSMAPFTPLKNPEILSRPMASMVAARPRVMAFSALAMDVAMPPVAFSAWERRDSSPAPPSLSSLMRACSSSSMVIVGSFLPPPSAS